MCNEPMQVYVPRGYDYREITVRCGNTSPSGDPWLCDKCAVIHKDRNWRQEALENGEQWDEEEGVG
tara:strand:+ start:368 stop:565 length:198 start_codon:yes stop_codon:yes gene_type:complete